MQARKRKYLITLVLVAIAACGVIGVAIASSEGSPAPSREGYEAGQRASLLDAPTASQTSTFGIFSRDVSQTDTVPTAAATQIEASGTFKGLFGANLGLARKANGFSQGVSWLVPGRGSICILAGAAVDSTGAPEAGMPGGATCSQESDAAAGRLYVVSGSEKAPGKQFVAGVVPNGVSEVNATLSDRSTTVLPVHENVYMALVSGAIASLSFNGPNGPVNLGHVGP